MHTATALLWQHILERSLCVRNKEKSHYRVIQHEKLLKPPIQICLFETIELTELD